MIDSGTATSTAAALCLAAALSLACSDRAGSAAGESSGSLEADTSLVRMAEELLPEVEERSRLPALRPPALASSSRERLEGYLSQALAEQLPPEKAEALGAAYARFGLLPDTLQIARLLRSLLLEQVVGYYDPGRDTLYVVEGVPSSQLEPVLVHELVHALQDQHMDLDSLMRAVQDHNDRASAAQAALEGHATYVMMEWLLSRQTGAPVDLTALPDLGGLLGGLDPAVLAGTPVLREAPRVIRESLIFPYIGGLVFLQRVWSEDDERPLPFGTSLPESSEQVIHPERFVAPRDRPSRISFVNNPPEPWTEVHADGLGELEVRILLEEHLGDPGEAAAAAEGWDGDRYRLLRGEAGEVLIWSTVWDTEEDAAEFEQAVTRAFVERYSGSTDRRVKTKASLVGDRPAVILVDSPADLAEASLEGATDFEVSGG